MSQSFQLRRSFLATGILFSFASIFFPYATVSGSVAGETLFKALPIGFLALVQIFFEGPPSVVGGLVMVFTPPFLVTLLMMILIGGLVSLRSSYLGSGVLMGAWLLIWWIKLVVTGTFSYGDVTSFTAAFSTGFYLLMIGSFLVLLHHLLPWLRSAPKHEQLALAGTLIVNSSLLLPYLFVSGDAYTLPGMLLVSGGVQALVAVPLTGFVLLGGFVASPPAEELTPFEWALKKQSYPVLGAAIVATALVVVVGVNSLVTEVGVNVSFGLGVWLALVGCLVLGGAGYEQRRARL